jgi:transposase InsO family protein/transposase-like protein
LPADGLPPCPDFTREPGAPFPKEVREHALLLVASGMRRVDVARLIGGTTEALRKWVNAAREADTMPTPPLPAPSPPADEPPAPAVPQRAPADPGQGLGSHEEAAILELKKRHPSMGPAQIRAQLKRFKGWRVSMRAIARVLTKNGYELVHTGGRPKDEEEVVRFEAPHRNALWQMDFVELRIGPERRALLLVEDDFSRFCVGHALFENPASEDVVEVLLDAIRRHGKPEAIYTDRGGPFLAWNKPSSLGKFLEAELIDHHVSPSYRPRGRGKIESLADTVQRELWHVRHFGSVTEAEDALREFFCHYNDRRAHMGIDGLTPADRFHGRWEEVMERVQAASRGRQGAAAFKGEDPFVAEEILPDGPFEILRLLVCDGRMVLAFLGHRVDLGEVKS